MKWIVLALLVHMGTLFSSPSVAQNPEPSPQNIVVLTSFPESFYSPIEQAFATQYPEHPIRFINKKTPALMAHLVQQRSPQPDLIWLSSSDAMAQLEQQGFIQQSHTFAWSQFGFFWNADRLAALGLPEPDSWETLTTPLFENQVAMSAPSRSGTNHLVIELVLQQYGWDEGWRLLLKLGGNLSTITARSFGVREGIIKQRFAVAPVVDFFYRSALASQAPVGFHPFPDTPLIPAQIGLTKQEKPSSRNVFVEFLLSENGQSLLSLPSVNRIPNQTGLEMAAKSRTTAFNSQLSASRYHTVNALFDQWITHRLDDLHRFWRLWYQVHQHPLSSVQQKQLAQVLADIGQIPVEEDVAADPTLNEKLSTTNRYEDFYQRITGLWQDQMSKQMAKGITTLERILAEVSP
ncbi:ABC transporter substrate-binding protein [Vibrio nigripulchritudo]|uniref:ABC transporter substrate-binding protein n=1 Tax=Vibrio nigripulchritudo TaxID=28173 RepID=UPI0003B20CF1|nr:ABC transporter substrate-binding protein [Vibrio nigripulchritudo]CCN73522.1 putative ABC-type Fe3+ transport system,periplasmic component [Vibrio nigripulchritudo SFn118]